MITPKPASRRNRPVSLYDLTFEQLRERLTSLGVPSYRAAQLYDWAYGKKVTSWDGMANVPSTLRSTLTESLPFVTMRPVKELVTDNGDTYKILYETFDGQFVETVLMLYRDRATVCVSCQVGCAVGCAFCATGIGGLMRNLTAGEMVQQTVDAARRASELGRSLTNLVMMGMGEPLQNYVDTMRFIGIIHDPRGLNFGARRITISTSGVVPRIDALAAEPLQVNLAVSLHAPNDELRSRLVPINNRYPIAELMAACDRYTAATGRRISFEYALMNGVNSSDEIARDLGELLRSRLCHVNVIPFNPVEMLEFERPDPEGIERFAEVLRSTGIPTTVRYSRGVEIAAACGQLRAQHERTNPLTPA
ncbi:MAG: 23S rRNA (adenine(2503)-C(2))-methyltransferase RlmN [Chloroflexota bacterium]|nr:23S rRNA (adenine(2503)-C(2))-methyltransferase RlmN [Chloroflexota bacterium]